MADDGLTIDPLTGAETCIDGRGVRPERREARSRLNRRRQSAVFEGGAEIASDQPLTTHAWFAVFARSAGERGVPVVGLSGLGLQRDADGKWKSEFLVPLKAGAEAIPFLDRERGVVYKLFDLRGDGLLGKKLVSRRSEAAPCGWEVTLGDANLFETLEKLIVLDEAGAHPTEIVGLLDTGDHLVVKQPEAEVISVGPAERAQAAGKLNCVRVAGDVLGGVIRVIRREDRAWFLGDLHPGNILRDANGECTIIDALIGKIPKELIGEITEVSQAAEEARRRIEGVDDGQAELF